jgi:hypothetical protein
VVCTLTYCPTHYIFLLLIGILLAALLAWFFLATQVAARWFGPLVALGRLRAPRRLSRLGRVLWTILAEGLVLSLIIVPALGYLIPLPANLAKFPNSAIEACFLISFFAALMIVATYDRSLEP